MPGRIQIAPSLLAADFSKLDREIKSAESAGADLLHVDIMDGHFVPNITIGPFVVEAITRVASAPLDVHLMITDPAKYASAFIDAGADSIAFHVEVAPDPQGLINMIRARRVKVGIAISPETDIAAIDGISSQVDRVMVMTVHPGFGGQKLIPECVGKVRRLASLLPAHVDIEVDGGISEATIAETAEAGANIFVAGTAIFGRDDRAGAIATLRRLAAAAYSRPGSTTMTNDQ